MKGKYNNLADEELAKISQGGNKEAMETLLLRYKGFILEKSQKYYISGLEKEDVIQEGMIGLFKAVQNFDGEKGASFKTFAGLCVERRLIDTLRSSLRDKNKMLNDSLSLDRFRCEDNKQTFMEFIKDPDQNPEERTVSALSISALMEEVKEVLSFQELTVWKLFIEGHSREDIAVKTGKTLKQTNNSLQRIKGKIAELLG